MGSPFPVALEGTAASGDSGGPLFALLGGSPFLVGTLSGGIGTNFYGDISVYSRVARPENLAFLQAHGIELSTPIPEPGTLTLVGLGLAVAWRQRRTRHGGKENR
jgi:MYXO-CTERM domain-containing protein